MRLRSISLIAAGMLAVVYASSSSAAPVELEVSSWKGGGVEIANFPELIAKFEKQNPDIRIKLTYLSRGDTDTVMPARMQGGDAPDVLMVDPVLARQWGRADQLLELSDQPWISALSDDYLANTKVDGKLYSLPTELSLLGIFGNLDLMKKAGVTSFPQNVAMMAEACGKLKKAGISPMLMPAKDGWAPQAFATALALKDGGKQNPGYAQSFVDGKRKFVDDANFNRGFEAIRALVDAGCFNPKINLGVDAWSLALSEFRAGRVAFLVQGGWNIIPFQTGAKKLNFSFGPFPALDGNSGVAPYVITTSWAISKHSKKIDAAKKWVAFWARDENLNVYLKAEAGLSPLKSGSVALPDLAGPFLEAYRRERTFFPEGLWGKRLLDVGRDTIMAFLANVNQDPKPLLARWDAAAIPK
ncbi:ABC transporter substrate-binding protein [Mesorhizobium sp. NPDC059054]|uniref:ABC transporter substrate-binding protein n=1 Tax=Mesorhizobium sp. NPDC059054 TaxID=3346711 RepID=UPI0036B36442